MRITVSVQVVVEENDGDANTFALTRVVNTGDNPAFVRGEVEKVTHPVTREILDRVVQTYPTLR